MDSGRDRSPRFQDYALIGDCRSAALVSRGGDLGWLCWPRFDSPALFAGLLDARDGGSWSLRPADRVVGVARSYVGGTAVVETRFETVSGKVAIVDFMPVASSDVKQGELWPEHQILRRVECLEGTAEVASRFAPRPDFGLRRFDFRVRGAAGFTIDVGRDVLAFRSDLDHEVVGRELRGRARLAKGEVRWSSLTFARGTPAYVAPLGETAQRRLNQTLQWWRRWSGRLSLGDVSPDALLRSAITLKLLTYAPSGAVVAAPTTSLPETPGGGRNWDYRYCWLRDAAMTIRAFYALGCHEEGEAFASWMLHATRLTQPELGILYDVYGNPPPKERELDHLAGYGGSRPVRIGNDARDQVQLDVYGEVVDAVAEYADRGGTLDRPSKRFMRGIGRTVARRWAEPDHGIWETRAGPQQHTYSRVRCWSALDRLARLDAPRRPSASALSAERDRIRAAIERESWNPELGSYVATAGGATLDASLLLMAEHGFVDGTNRGRFERTVRKIAEELAVGPFVYRYRAADGLEGQEGAFGICSFWLVNALIQIGDRDRARQHFHELLGYATDLGLYAEEFDASGAPLGNFPQAFTHVGLIHAALALGEAHAERVR